MGAFLSLKFRSLGGRSKVYPLCLLSSALGAESRVCLIDVAAGAGPLTLGFPCATLGAEIACANVSAGALPRGDLGLSCTAFGAELAIISFLAAGALPSARLSLRLSLSLFTLVSHLLSVGL